MKIEFSSQRREILLFLTANTAAVTSRANQQYTWEFFLWGCGLGKGESYWAQSLKFYNCVDLSEVPSQFTHAQSVLNQGEQGRLGPSIFLLLFYLKTISKKYSNASLCLQFTDAIVQIKPDIICFNPSTKLGKVIPIFNFIPLFFQQNESCLFAKLRLKEWDASRLPLTKSSRKIRL